jgi:hypothetical protein
MPSYAPISMLHNVGYGGVRLISLPYLSNILHYYLSWSCVVASKSTLCNRRLMGSCTPKGEIPRLGRRVLSLVRRSRASAEFGAPQVSLGREADPLCELYPEPCCGGCWSVSCVLASLSCAGLVVQLASKLSASCEGEPGSVV